MIREVGFDQEILCDYWVISLLKDCELKGIVAECGKVSKHFFIGDAKNNRNEIIRKMFPRCEDHKFHSNSLSIINTIFVEITKDEAKTLEILEDGNYSKFGL